MSFQSSDFLPVYRNGEPYKATANELKEYVQTGLDFGVTEWSEITGKPTTFPPSSHSHSYASTSHTHSGYASSSHNHNSSYVKGNYTITKSGNLYLIS